MAYKESEWFDRALAREKPAQVIDLETGEPVPFDGVNLIEGKPLNLTDEERAKLPPLHASETERAYADGLLCPVGLNFTGILHEDGGASVAYKGFRPVGDRFAVRIVPEGERKTDGGILLPVTSVEQPYELAEVVAIGPGKQVDSGVRLALEIAVGDWVYFRKNAGQDIEHQGETLKVLQERDLFAVKAGA